MEKMSRNEAIRHGLLDKLPRAVGFCLDWRGSANLAVDCPAHGTRSVGSANMATAAVRLVR